MYRRKLSEGSSMRNETIKLIMSTLFEKNAREEQHCERVSDLCRQIGDGTGYPVGLSHEAIPLQSKILYIADAFDAMTSDRTYRPGRTQEDAVSEIKKYLGTQFDAEIAKVFIERVLELEF